RTVAGENREASRCRHAGPNASRPRFVIATASPMSADIPENDQQMPLISHLTELRTRLLRCVAAVFLIFAGLFYFTQKIYTLVSAPLRVYLPEGATMIATDVASPFITPFKLTMMVALFLSMPVILHQIWGFIAPGLYKHEKRVAIPLLVSSIILFYAGMAFAYFLVFPIIFHFFASVTPEGVSMMTDIASYLDFVMTLFFAFGVAFEIPVAVVLLVWIGIVDVKYLKKIRPYVVIGCFVVGMILTPPDIFSQTLLAVPMWLLFELGILCSSMIKKRGEHPDDQAEDADKQDQPPATTP
ncbi:sec-independent protein translocase TatC, partial [Pseudomonas syringae pv. actinidiae ICMP 18807]